MSEIIQMYTQTAPKEQLALQRLVQKVDKKDLSFVKHLLILTVTQIINIYTINVSRRTYLAIHVLFSGCFFQPQYMPWDNWSRGAGECLAKRFPEYITLHTWKILMW